MDNSFSDRPAGTPDLAAPKDQFRSGPALIAKRLAILVTHPIQYYVPLFRLLHARPGLIQKVFYTLGEAGEGNSFDAGFARAVNWGIPLLDGYEYEFLRNISPKPGSRHFSGILNPCGQRKIREFRPDAILVYGWCHWSHLSLMRYFRGKTAVWFRGDSTEIGVQPKWTGLIRSIFLRWVYSHIDKAFYVGSRGMTYFERHGLRSGQLVFAPHAIDINHFGLDRPLEAADLRASLGVGEDEVLILFAGKFISQKNPLLLLKAFRPMQNKKAHLLLVGNGPLEYRLKTAARDYATSRIHFMDFLDQTKIPAAYQACDLFCLPSISETWGLAVNEAMAAGKAILVSDRVGCAPDLVDASNGAVFSSGSLNDLREKLEFLCADRDRLISLGLNSFARVKSWSYDRQVAAIVRELGFEGDREGFSD